MSLTCTNTGNCQSLNVPVITYLPLVKATESVLPTLLLIRDTIACHSIWVNLHRHHHWRQQCRLHFVLVSIRTCKTSASVVHDSHFKLTLAANTATRIPAYICNPLFVTHEHRPVELITRLIDTCSWAIAEHWAGLVDSSIKIEAVHFWPPSQCC